MNDQRWTIRLQQIRSPLGSLIEIGNIRESRGKMARFRYLQRYAFVLITRGSGHYVDELGRERSLTAGDWILVLPRLGHSYRPEEQGGWDETYAMFEGPVFEVWEQTGVIGPDRVIGRLPDPEAWLAEFHREVIQRSCGNTERVCAFQTLLAAALESAAGDLSGNSGGPVWFADACRLLAEPGAKIEAVAASLGVGYETFRRSFKQRAGIAPHRYHRQQIINIAARMLDTTDLKAAEIARTLGFFDEAHFSRAFKKGTGRSPRAYRAKHDAG